MSTSRAAVNPPTLWPLATEPLARCTACAADPEARRHILWECLPVGSYGDVRTAQCLTVGLNPSDNLFYRRGSREPRPVDERLPMLADFGVQERAELPDSEALLDAQRRYFQRPRHHPWFRPLQVVLTAADPSWTYASGVVAHVDSAACATNQWATLPPRVRQHLPYTCQPHFQRTISDAPPGIWVILNGRAVWSLLGPHLQEQASGPIVGTRVRWAAGTFGVRRYFAWNISIQRSSAAVQIALGKLLQAQRIDRP